MLILMLVGLEILLFWYLLDERFENHFWGLLSLVGVGGAAVILVISALLVLFKWVIPRLLFVENSWITPTLLFIIDAPFVTYALVLLGTTGGVTVLKWMWNKRQSTSIDKDVDRILAVMMKQQKTLSQDYLKTPIRRLDRDKQHS